MRKLLTLAAIALLAGCGASQPAAPPPRAPLTITGAMVVSDALDEDAGACFAKSGYGDIAEGVEVAVTGPSGTVVGIGRLGPGKGQPDGVGFADCGFPFTVQAPAGLGFYGVEVGHRGVVRYAEADLGGPVQLKIG